jgi:SET domain-containing protein
LQDSAKGSSGNKKVYQMNEKKLVVKKSLLPGAGKGLFTKEFIPKSSLIIEYKGKTKTWKEIKDSTIFNGYVFYITRNHVVDAMKTLRALARYANDAKGISRVKGLRNNAEYAVKQNKVFIRATMDIPAGAEIFVGYGKEYWTSIRHNKKIDKQSAAKNKIAA